MNEQLLKFSLGIDTGKDKLYACLVCVTIGQQFKIKAQHSFANKASGIEELHQWLTRHVAQAAPVEVIVEATGVYHENVCLAIQAKGHHLSVLLPNKARKYMEAMGLKSKNNKMDAYGLALIGARERFEAYQPLAPFYYELRQLTRYHQSLQQERTVLSNQLHALSYSAQSSQAVEAGLRTRLELCTMQIKQLRHSIREHLKSNNEIWQKVSRICTVKGLGILSIATVIAETNGFFLVSNVRQLVSYAGYDVKENRSGSHVGRTKISKFGNCRIRRILYMPSLLVVRLGVKPFCDLFDRVYQRSTVKMKGYVAVQRKLLIIMYTLWKRDETFCPKEEALDHGQASAFFGLETGHMQYNGDEELEYEEVVPSVDGTALDEHRSRYRPKPSFP